MYNVQFNVQFQFCFLLLSIITPGYETSLSAPKHNQIESNTSEKETQAHTHAEFMIHFTATATKLFKEVCRYSRVQRLKA